MKAIVTLLLSAFALPVFAQTYNNPGGTISTCSGTFYDTGGSGSNYSNGELIITTFCSSVPGQQIQVSFSQFNVENGWDDMIIYDGPNTGSPVIGVYTGNVGAFTVTSTSGCLTFDFFSDGSGTRVGWTGVISCIVPPTPADYTHPTTGIASEFVGSCLVSDCGPFTYADNGGVSGNYSGGINQIYRTFCPSSAGNCMQVTFNSFNVEAGYDFLLVNNGPTQNSPTFTTFPASATAYAGITGLNGNLNGFTPFSYTSTDASGCLTFRFYSDTWPGSQAAGWNATLQCVPCAGGPSGTDNSDCSNLTPLCSSAAVSGNSTGPGIEAEGCNGSACPAGGENHSNWYTFTAQTSGNIDITITPSDPLDDYDFAIYGPNVTCGALGSPLRCSDAGTTGTTGANGGAAQELSEDVTGDGITRRLNGVNAGDSYILVVDEWSPNAGSGYTLSFGGTASLDCTVLPIELKEFTAEYQTEQDIVDVVWVTDSELNSSHFEVEKSTDGVNFRTISTVNAMGNSQYETHYYVVDEDPSVGVNYYRLNQFDIDGNSKYSEIRSVNILDNVYDMLSVFPNPTTGRAEVIFNSYSKEDVLLNVTSSTGNVLVNMPVKAVNGGNRVELDMVDQASGVYIITVTTKDKVYKTKLVKE